MSDERSAEELKVENIQNLIAKTFENVNSDFETDKIELSIQVTFEEAIEIITLIKRLRT